MPKRRSTALLTLGIATVALLLSTLPACLPQSRRAPEQVSYIDTESPSPEHSYNRSRVLRNRVVPPREFTVAPVPPRNNDFGEFDDNLYAGLDRQPALPTLPGGQDIMPMIGGPADYPMAAASYSERRVGGSSASSYSSYPVSSPEAAGFAARAVSGGGSGATGPSGQLHPIEQLVYGGDYPDVDKPELYRLMPKDAISVTVKDHPEFSGKLEIQADGTIRVPNCPDLVRLRGLTVEEASEKIRDYLQVFIKGETIVSVQANRARGGYYFVFGDVTQPGRFPMGIEPIKLSDAVLAANWEANPSRMDPDEELGPAFPAASPRGKFYTRRSADLARVMLITPHRSQPVRTVHDIRSAMLGVMRDDPLVRPGQIIVVPSLDPERNRSLGLDVPDMAVPPDGLREGQGFSNFTSSARLPEVNPASHPLRRTTVVMVPEVEENMASAYSVQANTEAIEPRPYYEPAEMYESAETVVTVPSLTYEEVVELPTAESFGKSKIKPRSRKRAARDDSEYCEDETSGWKKGF